MKLISLYYVELKRLIKSKRTWIFVILSLLSPLSGYWIFTQTIESMSVKYIANPVLAGTIFGAILWGLLTIIENDRSHRTGTDIITNSIASVHEQVIANTTAIMTLATIVTAVLILLYLPYTIVKMDYLFSLDFYFLIIVIYILPTWWISILFADALYQIVRKLEIAILCYAGFVYFSFSQYAKNDFFKRWINPYPVVYSDGFPSLWPLRIELYTRLIWLMFALSLWSFSLLCLRKYQKNLLVSIIRSKKKVLHIALSAVFAASGILLWANQPFVDHGPLEYVLDEQESDDYIPISSVHYDVTTNPVFGTIRGKASYQFSSDIKEDNNISLNSGYKVTRITYDEKEVDYETAKDAVNGDRTTYFKLPNVPNKILEIEYEGFPAVARFAYPYIISDTVDKDYISLRSRAITPILNKIRTKDATFTITIPKNLVPLLNYRSITEYKDNQDGTRTWTSNCNTYIGSFLAGNYITEDISTVNANIELCYGKAYEKSVRENHAVQAIKDVFEYCTTHYGNIRFMKDNKLVLQQVSSLIGGGYASEGFSQWFETVLSPDSLKATEKGTNANEVFIHEMIHQWWGDLGLSCEDDGLWSCEGLTVYSTYRLVKDKYGELYAKEYYLDQWKKEVEEQNRNFYNRHPEYLKRLSKQDQATINTRNRSTNLYSRMPLMIYQAEQLVGGEEKMDQVLQKMYSSIFSNTDPGPYTYQQFLQECGLNKEDLSLE